MNYLILTQEVIKMSENKFWYEKGSNKRHSSKNKFYCTRAFIHNEMIDYF